MKYIWIRFSSPMMSCGGEAQSFSVRGTTWSPTFSEVLGMLAASMGISFRKDQREMVELRDGVLMDTFVLQSGSLLRDYQGAGGGISKKESDYLAKCIPSKPGGALENKIYVKEYLQDAKFDIVLRVASESLADRIALGMQEPKWVLFAGRKACHLTEVPLGGVFDTPEKLMAVWAAEGRRHVGPSRIHVPPGTPGGYPVGDLPLCRGDNRTSVRYVMDSSPEMLGVC